MKIISISFLLVASFFAFTLLIADEEKVESKETAEEKENEVQVEKSLEEFVPSEEISIDKPVAFPVDI